MTTLYLIRHGATNANLQRPYWLQGCRRDLPLAELGVAQAERVAELLGKLPLAAVISSPLQRARATAECLARRVSQEVQIEDALTEGDVGRWEGRTYEEIQRDDADAYHRFLDDPVGVGYPDGETFSGILARVQPCLTALAEAHQGKAIAVVTHQIACRVFLATLLRMPLAMARYLKTSNGGISVVHFDHDRAECSTFNSTFHLAGVETPP